MAEMAAGRKGRIGLPFPAPDSGRTLNARELRQLQDLLLKIKDGAERTAAGSP